MSKFKGIVENLSNEDYHGEVEHLSSSNLKTLLKDIEKFHKEKVLQEKVERKPSTAFDEGSLTHAMILEPHVINDEFAFWSEFRKQGKEFEAFKLQNEGKIIISKPQLKRVEGWVKGYNKNRTAVDLVSSCKAELSLFGELNGVPIKVRADAINIEEGYIADIKTSSFDVDRDSFKMTIDQYEYDLSAALYCEMFSQHYGKPFDFYFVCLSKKDASCEVFKLSEESKSKGLVKIRKALSLYKKCLETGVWTDHKLKYGEKEYGDYEILEV